MASRSSKNSSKSTKAAAAPPTPPASTLSSLLAYSPRYGPLTEWTNTGTGPEVPVYTVPMSSFRHLSEIYSRVAASDVRHTSLMVKIVPSVPYQPTPGVLNAVSELIIKEALEESYAELRPNSGVFETIRTEPSVAENPDAVFPMSVSTYCVQAKTFQSRILPDSTKVVEWEDHLYGSLGKAVPPYTYYAANCDGGVLLPHVDLSRVSLVNYLDHDVPGLSSCWFYAGMARTTTELHHEDLGLPSVNISVMGEPKHWLAIAPADTLRVVSELRQEFPSQFSDCEDAFDHRRWLITPGWLRRHGIQFSTCLQFPGEAILLLPNCHHQVMNTGFSLAQACNLADRQWVRDIYGPMISQDHFRQCECPVLNAAGLPPKVTRALLREDYLQTLLDYDLQLLVKSQLDELLRRIPALAISLPGPSSMALEPARHSAFSVVGSSMQSAVDAALSKAVAKRAFARALHKDVFPFYRNPSLAIQLPFQPRPVGEAEFRRFSCSSCPRTYVHKVSLYRHRGKMHGVTGKHACPQCGRAFYMSSTLQKHVEKCGR